MMEAIKKIELPTLSTRCVIGALKIGVWGAERVDDGQSRRVIKLNGAGRRSARVVKRLVDRNNDYYKALCVAADALRTTHKTAGMTWDGKARVLIPTVKVQDYLEAMAANKRGFNAAVKALCNQIEEIKAEAKDRLGTMFEPSDYPTEDGIKSACYAEFHLEPVPQKGDFRVDLDAELLTEAADNFEAQVRSYFSDGLKREALTLLDEVKGLGENLAKDGRAGMIKETMVSRARDMAIKLRSLNVMADPDLEALCQRVVKLTDINIDAMRDDTKTRTAAGVEANQISAKLKSAIKYF